MVVASGAGADEGVLVLDEEFSASTLRLLRDRLGACAAAAGMPRDRVADLIIAVHELAANTVRHGAGAGRLLVRAAAGGALRCQVSDAGPSAESWPLRRGHGLWIVRAVADEVSTTSGPLGSDVTAVFRWGLRAPAPGHANG